MAAFGQRRSKQQADQGILRPLLIPLGGAPVADEQPVDAAHPGSTGIRAGTYVLMDNDGGRMAPGFERSLTIQASVISRHSGKVIVDAGSSAGRDGHDTAGSVWIWCLCSGKAAEYGRLSRTEAPIPYS